MKATLPSRTPQAHWLARWRRLASLTAGLTEEDPRFPTIIRLLHECERHERADNDQAFIRTATQIVHLMALPTPLTLPTDIAPPHPPGPLR